MQINPQPGGEAWKYTNIDEIFKHEFCLGTECVALSKEEDYFGAIDIDSYNIILTNGMLSHIPKISNVKIGKSDDNTVTIEIADNAVTDKPLHIKSIGNASNCPMAFYPKINIIIGAGSKSTIVETHSGSGEMEHFSNPQIKIDVGENATLMHYKLQEEDDNAYHIALTEANLAKGANYDGFILQTGGKISRCEFRATVSGGGASCNYNGAYLANKERLIDNTTFIDHAVPDTQSEQVFKGIIDDTGRGVYQGKVLVRKDSQRTDGKQLHKALLLSDTAEVDCKPELEIYADDVKCAHGATAGELDDNQIFYLRSRGLDENQARQILINAFLDDAVEKISDENMRYKIKERLNEYIESLL